MSNTAFIKHRNAILKFWFEEINPKQWWQNKELDAEIKKRFQDVYNQLSQNVSKEWCSDAKSYLAAIIVLDQFSRNIFRNEARAFATDQLALELSNEAIAKKLDQDLSKNEKTFLYMPFQHSESKADQEISIKLFTTLEDDYILSFAQKHKDIIDRFGRYPHRNQLLGRQSTQEEVEFLKQPGLFW